MREIEWAVHGSDFLSRGSVSRKFAGGISGIAVCLCKVVRKSSVPNTYLNPPL